MGTRLRAAAVLAIGGALTIGTAVPAAARPMAVHQAALQPAGPQPGGPQPAGPPPTVAQPPLASWAPDLTDGESAGVMVEAGVARVDPETAFPTPAGSGHGAQDGPAVAGGLLTLPERGLRTPTDRVGVAVAGELPAGSTATVDVRGRRAGGGWTEWVPATAGPDPAAVAAVLPEATSTVQGRVALTGGATVTGLTLTAFPATAPAAAAPRPALSYRVFATREGLAGATTANGHVITERDHFVALPSRRALSSRGTSDYSVRVCTAAGRCAYAPVWDVGPWNTRDDYWNPPWRRQEWADLPQGVPQAQAAFTDHHNGGLDQYGRPVKNPAGIDLGDGVFWDDLGLRTNSWVTVEYLWTGTARLARVNGGPVEVKAGPQASARVVGVAAGTAAVPVECALGSGPDRWLRIAAGQFLRAEQVGTGPEPVQACAAEGAATPDGAAHGPAPVPAGAPDGGAAGGGGGQAAPAAG